METLRRTKRSELSEIKRELIKMQGGKCPICGGSLNGVASRNIVVDHDHKTGVIRGALHRGCNGVEGKVLKFLKTWGKCETLRDMVATLERLCKYWKFHRVPQTKWIHPTYKTDAEKREDYNKKRRQRAKTKRAKK